MEYVGHGEHPRPPRPDLSGDLSHGHHTVSLTHTLPAGLELDDPLSPTIFHWLNHMARAAKGLRVYAPNNETLRRYLDEAFGLLTALLEQQPELTLAVREDRLLYGKDPVHVNPDRAEGIPFTFYRNAFRRLTFVRGMSRDELISFLTAIITDYSGYDFAGEDLVTALWRLQLPHLRYLTIDALTIDPKKAGSERERDDIERVQADIEGIVAVIYKTNAPDDDIVAGVSITREDLEALKSIRQEAQEDLDLLDHATARAIADVTEDEIEAIHIALIGDTRDTLARKLMDVLVHVLFKEQSASESAGTIELIQQLFDQLLVGQRFEDATELILSLQKHQTETTVLKETHIIRHLLRLFSTESRVVPVLNAFNDEYKAKSVHVLIEFLRALGPTIVPILLDALEFLSSPGHRRLICDLVLEWGVPDRQVLMQRMTGAKWFVARDLLTIAHRLPPEHLSAFVSIGLKHEHPKVRELAVGLLRGYSRGTVDRLVAERILDEDLEVRMAATRVAAARRSAEAKPAIETLINRDDLGDREPREVKLLMAAYAAIAGPDAIPTLERVLAPSLFGRAKLADAQIAAAFALASIGTQAAMQAIQKGSRTLNTRVREACRKALAREFDRSANDFGGPTGEIPKTSTPPPGSDNALETLHESKTVVAQVPKRHDIPAEPTPITNRSAKSMGVPTNAPEFFAELPEAPAAAQKPVMLRSGPALGRVSVPHPVREELPVRMPVPVLESATPAPEVQVPPWFTPIELPEGDEPVPLDPEAFEPIVAEPQITEPVVPVEPQIPRMMIPDQKTERAPIPKAPTPVQSREVLPFFERMPAIERQEDSDGQYFISRAERVPKKPTPVPEPVAPPPPVPPAAPAKPSPLTDDLFLGPPSAPPSRRMIAEDEDDE